MNRINEGIVINILVLTILSCNAYSFDDKDTHPRLATRATSASILPIYLEQQLGFREGLAAQITKMLNNTKIVKPVWRWLSDGSMEEDSPMCRAMYHFHDPLRQPWSLSYMTDTPWVFGVCSSVGWTQNYSNVVWATGSLAHHSAPTATYPEEWDNILDPPAPNNWNNARGYYFVALTSTLEVVRQTNFAKTFQAVGQVMHLLQDVAVPAHVRNDFWSHLKYTGISSSNFLSITDWVHNLFEFYLMNRKDIVDKYGQNDDEIQKRKPSIAGMYLTDLWDTGQYRDTYVAESNYADPSKSMLASAGLAEYTNANFISDSTIFTSDSAHKYPYPKNVSTCVQIVSRVIELSIDTQIARPYYSKVGDGDSGYLLAGIGYMPFKAKTISADSGETLTIEKMLSPMDDIVHDGYAERLIPRAVGYSAALLDYFFRGTLEISWPSDGVYSIADGSKTPYADVRGNMHQQFNKVRTAIANTTPNEPIKAGTLTAVARYKIIPNYTSDLSNYPPDSMTMKAVTEYSYSVSKAQNVVIGDIVSDYYTDFTFDFAEMPIPSGITDLTLQVVFKGTIGNETDNAIAVGMKDLMEPTHLTFWNSSDMFELQYAPYTGPTYSLYTFNDLKQMADADSTLLDALDLNNNGTLIDDLIYQPFDSTFTVSFWDGYDWILATTVEIPPARHIRLIALVDTETSNYVNLNYTYPNGSNSVWSSFAGVVNQADKGGKYPVATPVKTFRKSMATDGTYVPFYQHFSKTVVGCHPVQVTDSNGNPISCPYADDTALPIQNVTPVAFTTAFD